MIARKVRVPAARSSRPTIANRLSKPRKARLRASASAAALLIASCGLAPFPRTATSLGSANDGVLISALALPNAGRGFARARPDDTRFGVPLLVSALTRAAAHVSSDFPGTSALRIGDLSAPGGGNHDRHGSHRSGRDADVLFYLLDERGVSIPGSGFFAFDERGAAAYQGRLVFFDIARNWALVRTLLADEQALVQWIFCAYGIKARLLAYGAQHERDPALLLRAAYVLHQPSYGNPHRDHFHIRIACSADELATGCVDHGPTWPWLRNLHEKAAWEGPGNDDATLVRALLAELGTGD
jgi:penicillin-insensitive murein endopeptidase